MTSRARLERSRLAAERRAAGPLPRILARTTRTANGCLRWDGPVSHGGYAIGWWEGRTRTLHIQVYKLAHGPVPPKHTLDHTCHTNDPSCLDGKACVHRRCLEEKHLEPVTPTEQQRRAHRPPAPTACPSGHPYTAENSRVMGSRRGCRTCHRDGQHGRYYARHGGCAAFKASGACPPCLARARLDRSADLAGRDPFTTTDLLATGGPHADRV